MFALTLEQQNNRGPEGNQPKSTFRLWPLLAAAAVSGTALALVPVLLPGLAASISATSEHAYWYISRASAFVAFGMIWLSMLAGLGITSKLGRVWPGMPGSFELHKFTALLGIGFGLVHALVLLGDKYLNYNIVQLLLPFAGNNYRPEWVGFGQIAFYMLLVVTFSFYVRDRLGTHTWRMIHMLSFALFLATVVHGLNSGTDSANLWAQTLYWGSAASVLLGSVYRVIAVRGGRARNAAAATQLVAVAGKAQPRPGSGNLVAVGRPAAQTRSNRTQERDLSRVSRTA